MSGPEPDESTLEQLRSAVEEYGCQMVAVAGDDAEPELAFSVGLFASYAHPEVLVFGLEPDLAQEVFDQLADQIEEGARFVADAAYAGIIEGFRCVFRTVPQRHYQHYLKLACDFYGDEDFPVLQAFWPDQQGRFPWDDGVRAGYSELQPVLEELDGGER